MAKIKHSPPGMSLKERLAWRSKPGPNGCIDYDGYISPRGAAIMNVGGNRSAIASRVAYEVNIGPIPAGLYVLHSCDRGCCINPAHLRVGTQADNMRDMVARGRSRAVLSEADVLHIRSSSVKQRVLADRFGVSEALISVIKSRQRWKHL